MFRPTVPNPSFTFSTRLVLLALFIGCADHDPQSNSRAWTRPELPVSNGVLMSGYVNINGVPIAVGGAPGEGVILAKDTEGWSLQHETADMLHWVHGSGETIWSVGANGAAIRLLNDSETLISENVDTELDLWGVWVFSDDNVWVVGGDPRAAGQTKALIKHFDGRQWETIELPTLDRPCPSLFKVWGQHPNSIYFVGANGVILHWDGTRIHQIIAEVGDDLVALWGDDHRVIIVGGRIRGVIISYDGSAWSTHLLPTTSGLNGIWLRGQHAIAVGHRGMVVDIQLSDISKSTVAQPTTTLLHGIFGADETGLTAVGGTLDQPMPWSPVLLEAPTP